MPVHVTYFDARLHSDPAALGVQASNARGVFGDQLGDAETLTVGASASPGNIDAANGRLALIKTTEACRIDIVSSGGAATAASGWWASGEIDVRFLALGQRLSVIQP